MEKAEIQFASDLSYNDCIKLVPWGLVDVFDAGSMPGIPSGTIIELATLSKRYMRHDQIIDEAQGAYPTIGTVNGTGGHAASRYGYPLVYETITELSAAAGMELRVSLENGLVFGGERATVTFYGIYKDEA